MRNKENELALFKKCNKDFKQCCIELDKWSPSYFNGFYDWAYHYINTQKELITDFEKFDKLCEIKREAELSLDNAKGDVEKMEYIMVGWLNYFENKVLKQKIADFKESLLKEFGDKDSLVKDYINYFNL